MPAEQKNFHFGVLSSAGAGHLNPLIALAQELVRRGHEVTFFGKPKIKLHIKQAGFSFVPIAAKVDSTPREPAAATATIRAEIAALRSRLARMRAEIELYLAETPPVVARAGVAALLVDEIALTGPTVAQLLDLPYFLVATSVPHHLGWHNSSPLSDIPFWKVWLPWLQRAFLEQSVLRTTGPVRRTLDRFRRAAGFRSSSNVPRDFPALAHITQLPQCLELRCDKAQQNLHYAGPFINRSARPRVPFPWARLDGRAIVYASLGTTAEVDHSEILRMVAAACHDLDVQIVISLGNRFEPEEFANLPGGPVVVRFAPQLEMLKRAALVITHGGANTAFETLLEGKPMVVIPLAYDQPAIAARLKRVGAAEVLPARHLSPQRIRRAVATVLGQEKYREAARHIQAELQALCGSERAATIIEEALEKHFLKRAAHACPQPLSIDRLACEAHMPERHPAVYAKRSKKPIASFRSQ